MFELMDTNDFQSKLLALVQEENAKQAKKDDNYEAKIASLSKTVAEQKAKMQELEKQNNDYFAETESQSQEINFLKKQLAEAQAELKVEQDKSKKFADRANSLEKVILTIQQSLSSVNTLVDSAVGIINDDKNSTKPTAKTERKVTKKAVAEPEQPSKTESKDEPEETRNDTEYLLKNKANREALQQPLKEAEEIEKHLDEHGEPKDESKAKPSKPQTEDGVEVNFNGEEQAPTKLSGDVPGFKRAERNEATKEEPLEPKPKKENFDDTLKQVASTPDPFDNFKDDGGQDEDVWDNADPYDGNNTFTLSEEADDGNSDMDEEGNPNTFKSKSGSKDSPWGDSGANFNEGSVENSPETADETKTSKEEAEDNSVKGQKDEVDDKPLTDDSNAETKSVSEETPVKEKTKNMDEKQIKDEQPSPEKPKGTTSNPKSSSAETQSASEEPTGEKESPADNFAKVESQEERQKRNNLPTCADDDKDSSSVSWYFADRLTRLNGDELPPDWTSTQQGRAAFVLANFNKMREQIVDEAPWSEEEESAFQKKARKAQEYLNNNPGQKARVEHEVEKGAGRIDD